MLKDFYAKVGVVGWPANLLYALLGGIAAGHNILLTGKPGSFKTKFIRNFGKLLGYKTRIFDVDKLSVESLMGDLNPEVVGQTSKSIDRLSKAVLEATGKGSSVADKSALSGKLFINSVCDFELIGWDEVLRGDPATQQSLMLNIVQDRIFQGEPVKATQISCTNTGFDELYEFNEALLNRFQLIFRCPSMIDMPAEMQDRLIDESGHGKYADSIVEDPEFRAQYDQLVKLLTMPRNSDLDRIVKNFMKHLKNPLAAALRERFSGRIVDSMTKVLYTTLFTYMVVEGVAFKDLDVRQLRDIFRDTFMSTVYIEDLDANRVNQIKNAFHLAFEYSFDVTELTLRDRLMSVPNFLVNCEDFVKHINGVQEDKVDVGGVAVFVDRLKKHVQNDEPRRYILYKWFTGKISGKNLRIEKDELDPIINRLGQMDRKLEEFAKANAKIELSSKSLDLGFLEKIRAAASDRIFSSVPVDTSTFASLVTTVKCFGPDMVNENGTQYVTELYQELTTLKRI